MALILTQITTLLLAISMLLVMRALHHHRQTQLLQSQTITALADAQQAFAEGLSAATDTLSDVVDALIEDDAPVPPGVVEALRRQFKN